MRALIRAVLVAALSVLLVPLQANAWVGTLVANSPCSDVAGTLITFPTGRGSFYAYGTFGGGTLTPVFMLADGVTPAPIDPAQTYASTMTKPIGIQFMSGQRVCAQLTGVAVSSSITVEIFPEQERTVDGALKYRY